MPDADLHSSGPRVGLALGLKAAAGVFALYLGTLLYCRHAIVADGYDGVGFVLALEHFDLGRFQPQPPGYPLLVMAGRAVHAAGVPPALALALVNALLLALGLGAVAGFLRASRGR